jgi:hypothetical protein
LSFGIKMVLHIPKRSMLVIHWQIRKRNLLRGWKMWISRHQLRGLNIHRHCQLEQNLSRLNILQIINISFGLMIFQ